MFSCLYLLQSELKTTKLSFALDIKKFDAAVATQFFDKLLSNELFIFVSGWLSHPFCCYIDKCQPSWRSRTYVPAFSHTHTTDSLSLSQRSSSDTYISTCQGMGKVQWVERTASVGGRWLLHLSVVSTYIISNRVMEFVCHTAKSYQAFWIQVLLGKK